MTEQNEHKLKLLSDFIKPIFLKWEQLRIPYNVILAVVFYVFHDSGSGIAGFSPLLLIIGLIGAVLANICFLAAPIAESYLAWLGLRSYLVTAGLFIGGVVISIPCVIFFTMPFFGPFGIH